ncbi:cytochrome P450 [Aquipuribacter hungaricus]|uniref:Cytochrome P450 n=1 Tax=Aquipuribacter hungaricus TaxID=545624 RepID=A0ABV7WL14_9MICO
MSAPPAPRRNARFTEVDADGPLPWHMVAAVPRILSDALPFLEETAARYGDVVPFPMNGRPAVLVDGPAGVRRVLQDNHRGYGKETIQYTSLALVTGAGLLTTDGEVWRAHRRAVQPAFHRDTLAHVAAESVRAAGLVREEWDAAPGRVVDVDDVLMRATLHVVGRTLFGADLVDGGAAEGHRLVGAVHEALEVVMRRATRPWTAPPGVPTPTARRLTRSRATLDEACAAMVRSRRAQREPGHDVLGLLLASGMTDGEVRDELVTLVIAGHETVAASLTWTLRLLAEHPEVVARVHAELDAVLGDGTPGSAPDGTPGSAPGGTPGGTSGGTPGGTRSVTWQDVARLPVVRAVVDEGLRLYPPAWVITRRALADDVVDGVPLPAGTLVILSPWVHHRRADLWPDPTRFDVDRWLGEPAGGRREGYIPFGAGPRLCIGRDFAVVESVVVLAELLRDRTVAPAGPRPGVVASVTLRPRGGMHLAARPRRPVPPRP